MTFGSTVTLYQGLIVSSNKFFTICMLCAGMNPCASINTFSFLLFTATSTTIMVCPGEPAFMKISPASKLSRSFTEWFLCPARSFHSKKKQLREIAPAALVYFLSEIPNDKQRVCSLLIDSVLLSSTLRMTDRYHLSP